MEVVGTLSAIAGIVQISFRLRSYERATLSQSYGGTAGFFISTFFGNTASEFQRLQRVVLRGSDAEALRFRDSVTNECNMTAVAGAIIAQVALTALSLMNLNLAHWTARAFLLFATVAGCLSVYYACSLSRGIGKLYQAEFIRDWLSGTPLSGPDETGPGERKERNASISAIFILSAPYTMMSYAIFAFLLGLAIYQGFVWTRNLDADAGKLNSRHVFIAYIVSTGFCQMFFLSAGVIKAIEELLLHDVFKTKLLGSVMNNRDHIDRHRDGEGPAQLEAYASANYMTTSTTNAHPATQQHRAEVEGPYRGLAAALEAAAKAHTLSAEADRRVATEYAKLSGPQERSNVVE